MADERDEWGQQAADAFAAGQAPADMQLDFGGMTGKDVDEGIEKVDKEGDYHFEIQSIKPNLATKDKGEDVTPHLLVDLLVGHSVAGQSPAGSHLYWRVFVAPKGGGPMSDFHKASLARLGVATGIMHMPQGEDGPLCLIGTNEQKFSISAYQKAVGKQLIGHVKREPSDGNNPKTGKPYPDKYGFPYNKGFGPVDDPKFADVPKNRDWLKAIGKEHCMPKAGSTPPVAKSEAKTTTNGAAIGGPAKSPAGKPPFDDSDL